MISLQPAGHLLSQEGFVQGILRLVCTEPNVGFRMDSWINILDCGSVDIDGLFDFTFLDFETIFGSIVQGVSIVRKEKTNLRAPYVYLIINGC